MKCKLRRILSDVNADRKDLFTAAGLAHLAAVPLSDAARFVADQLMAEYHALRQQLKELTARLKAFAAEAPTAEAEARAVLRTIPGVGPVTVDVVVSELGDVDRFGSAKKACAYAGLVPTVRESGGEVQGAADHQAGLGAAAVGVGGGVVAAGAAEPSLAIDL